MRHLGIEVDDAIEIAEKIDILTQYPRDKHGRRRALRRRLHCRQCLQLALSRRSAHVCTRGECGPALAAPTQTARSPLTLPCAGCDRRFIPEADMEHLLIGGAVCAANDVRLLGPCVRCQSSRRSRWHHRLRCPDISPYSRSSSGRARAEPHEDCRFADRSERP